MSFRAIFFSLSNATPHRWLCRTRAIEYNSPTGWVTNRTWGVPARVLAGGVSLAEISEEYILGAGQTREFYVPGIVTNRSLVVRLDCQGKASGLLGRINDYQDKKDASSPHRLAGVTSETFWGGPRYTAVMREGKQ